MENTDGRGLLQQNPPVNLLNPMALTLPYPNAYHDAYYVRFQNPNPVQSWDSNSQNDVIHPPGVEPATVTHSSSSGCGTLPPVSGYTYLQNQAIASSSTPVPHYYHDPSVQLALAPFGTGITEPATVRENMVPTNISSSLLINQEDGPQKRGIRKKGQKKIKTVQSAWCAVCKVDCNSKSVLDQHKLGRKHKKNLKKLIAENACVTQCLAVTPAQAPVSADIPAPTTLALPPTGSSALVTENVCVLTQCLAATPAQAPASADIPAPTTLALPPTVSTALATGPNGNLDAAKPESGQKSRKKAAGNEDLETKRRKMLEGGVAAKDFRMCTICNVVCNSEMVLMNHLAGQKHATMMKKSASTTGMAVTT